MLGQPEAEMNIWGLGKERAWGAGREPGLGMAGRSLGWGEGE